MSEYLFTAERLWLPKAHLYTAGEWQGTNYWLVRRELPREFAYVDAYARVTDAAPDSAPARFVKKQLDGFDRAKPLTFGEAAMVVSATECGSEWRLPLFTRGRKRKTHELDAVLVAWVEYLCGAGGWVWTHVTETPVCCLVDEQGDPKAFVPPALARIKTGEPEMVAA